MTQATGGISGGRFRGGELSKEERFERVTQAVVTSLLSDGLGGLRHATLARRSGVSRQWIYKYLGRDHEDILEHAARTVAEAFVGFEIRFNGETLEEWREWLAEGTRQGLLDSERDPWVMRLYFQYRHELGRIGEAIRHIDQRYLDKFLENMPASLRRNRTQARQFALVFNAGRMGIYYRWTDPAFRVELPLEEAVQEVLRPLDGFVVHK